MTGLAAIPAAQSRILRHTIVQAATVQDMTTITSASSSRA